MYKYKYSFVLFATILFLGMAFANHNYDFEKQTCLQLGNSEQNCSNFVNEAQNTSKILDLSYAKVQDLMNYVACVDSEKAKSNFDYRSIKNICYGTQNDKALSSFKSRCFYDLDSNKNVLSVKCKGIFPSEDYSWDLVLENNANKDLILEPKIILNSDFAINGTKFSLFAKDINLLANNITLLPNSKINLLPLALEVRDTNGSLKSLFQVNSNSSTMDPIYKSYLDCITIQVLMADSRNGKYLLKKSGLSFLQEPNQIFESCTSLVTYAFAVDLTTYEQKRNMFLDMLNILVDNYLNDSNFSSESMISEFNNIDDEYKKYSLFESQINNNKDATLALSLDADYFLARLQSVTKGLPDEERKAILESAGPTLLKNKEDTLSVRKKTKLSGILDYFNNDQNTITDKELKQIYFDIEYSLIKSHFQDSETVDLTDVIAKLSSHSIAIDQFSFDFITPMKFDYLGDKNYPVVLTKNEDLLTIKLPDYNLNTALALSLEGNSIFVGSKKVNFLNAATLNSIASGNVEITGVNLELDGDIPIFVVKQQILGKLLGIINVKEVVKSNYFATTGILSDISKPWWDFLVIYTK